MLTVGERVRCIALEPDKPFDMATLAINIMEEHPGQILTDKVRNKFLFTLHIFDALEIPDFNLLTMLTRT